MVRKAHTLVLSLTLTLTAAYAEAKSPTFVCQEPGGKRLIEVSDNDISRVGGKIALRIDTDGYINDADGKHVLYVSDDDVRTTPTGVKLVTFDGESIRHGTGGKIVLNYRQKEICPDPAANRIYSIEGDDSLSKAQLVAAMYLLKPELFKLTDAEEAEQKKAMADAAAEQDKVDDADQIAGSWMVLNSSGVMEKLGQGSITVTAKKGDAYPVAFDLSKGDGPKWTGVGAAEPASSGEQPFFIAYGTPKTVGLCVYDISGGTLKGKWSPWYIDGNPKNTGTETLDGPATLDGDFKITAASAPTSGAAYAGTVTIKPLDIVGTSDDAKPYSIVWTIGTVKINGIGIKSGKRLYVASGTGADTCIARYVYHNGSMNSDWFKLGSTEKGSAAAMKN